MAVEINENSVNEVIKAIEDASVEGISNFIKVDYNKLVSEANKFLSSYEILDQQKELFSKQALREAIISNPASAIKNLSTRASKETYILRSQYLLAIKFEEYLDKFRENQLPRQALYVTTSSEGTTSTFVLSMQELIAKADKDGRLNISENNLKKQGKQALEQQQYFLPQEHVNEAQAAIQGVTNRLRRYYERVGKSGSLAQGGILMWKEEKDWVLGRITNQGDLKEAYANFLLDTHQKSLLCNYNEGSPEYYNHAFIGSFFDNYINEVKNTAAIKEEDISDGLYQYGIKSAKSELPGMKQYLTTAQWIVKQTNVFTKEEIEKFLDIEFPQKAKRNIRVTLEDIGNKVEKKVIDDVMKKLS